MTIIVTTTATNPGYTFLQLVQRLCIEAGSSGTGPASTVAQTGEFARMVNWINAAWIDIQAMHQDWDWMRSSASFATSSGQAVYPLAAIAGTSGVPGLTDFGKWDAFTARNYIAAAGANSEVFMDAVAYDEWRDMYFYGALRNTTSRPVQFAVAPDKSICLGPVPAAGYVVTLDYWRAPAPLVNDSDVPALPPQFQLAIVYRAMQFYGKYEKDDGVVQYNQVEFDKIMRQAAADRLPRVSLGAALA